MTKNDPSQPWSTKSCYEERNKVSGTNNQFYQNRYQFYVLWECINLCISINSEFKEVYLELGITGQRADGFETDETDELMKLLLLTGFLSLCYQT